ncbi:class I adenylate-forming enzyme family protein [Arthrobacter sp. NIO-1057]|uniref:class I adenylate-forming enzyme family protein n=1 Tax=Arthrobacter sp. NIO-1057 TaxID=993071 RepID=UPI00071D26AB|nr:AMP-binding protein [Arthrobacter sp. NIO-1057]KSU68116.1 hypothetical protein AS038_03245 [Arthrobacter sp. NIO-1057]SCB88917.1 Acyl-CoA synthetase (AMP-forming)/AMP-acid ligase II [Arthrobacter sp. NIO-1057]
MNFWDALTSWAECLPHKSAVVSLTGELTYAQLAGRAQHLARTLRELPEQRVGILANDPITMAVGFHGAALAGKTLVILDPSWPEALLHTMVSTLKCAHIMTDFSAADLQKIPATVFTISENADNAPWVAQEHPEDRELLIICTSGTTSRPKAIIRTARSWQCSVEVGAPILKATEASITLSPGPISHGLGLYSLVESIHTGGTFVGSGRWSTQGAKNLLGRLRCNRVVTVPTILDRLFSDMELQQLASIRWVISGGESLSPRIVAQLQKLPSYESCVEYFGSSEHSLIAYSHRDTNEQLSDGFSGQLFPTVSVHLHAVDPVTGIGTAYVDSPFNAIGYDPHTAPSIARCNASTSTLDQARQFSDQQIAFIRREDGMLNLHGNNIHPAEIIAVFSTLNMTEVKIHLDTESDKPRLIAYVRSPVIDGELLRENLFEQLPVFKVPHEVVSLNSWPQGFSGKASITALSDDAPEILKRIQIR